MGFKLTKQIAAVHGETVKDVATEFLKLDEKANGFTDEFGVKFGTGEANFQSLKTELSGLINEIDQRF